jgi:uncharacterized circularly permuted ATP-grasp superfamily protein
MSKSTADESSPVSSADAISARWASVCASEAYDELRDALLTPDAAPTEPAAHWSTFFDALGPEGPRDAAVELSARAARVQRRVREDGVTYNVHAPEGTEASREWPLQLLPFIIGADQWAAIERGVTQRARLLNATLADVYGPQTLLRDAVLPPSLVFAHPQYLRPAHGVVPPGGVYLHVAAFDIARGPEGRWWVLSQRLQAPSGLGYLLENRLLVAQEFPEAFTELRVQRVAAAFSGWLSALRALSPAGERARIVLLTPGPLHETYFEQVFLARYLGISLVEAAISRCATASCSEDNARTRTRAHRVATRRREWLDPLEFALTPRWACPACCRRCALAGGRPTRRVPVCSGPGWPRFARRVERLLAKTCCRPHPLVVW